MAKKAATKKPTAPRATKAKMPDPDTPSLASVTSAVVTQVEDQVAEFRDIGGAHVLAPYARALALGAAMFNAKILASIPMRLYKPAASADGGGFLRDARKRRVSTTQKRRLCDPDRVGRKAALMADRAGDVEEVLDHPVLDLLRRPDPFSTGMAWEALRWVQKQLFGEALLLKIQGAEGVTNGVLVDRREKAAPNALVSLYPQWARVQPDDEMRISGWYYGRELREQYTADQIMQMKWAEHPTNPYRGLGWLELCLREMEIDDYALAAELTRWKNGGYPEGVLAFKNVKSQAQLDEAVAAFHRQIMRARKKGGIVATSEADYSPLAIAEDMEYESGIELVERRILNYAGIPLVLYRMTDSNRASATEGDPTYAKYTLAPALAIDAEQWTELLLPLYGLDPTEAWFCYDEVSARDRAAVREDVSAFVGKVWTVNECRAELGYDPDPNPKADELTFGAAPMASPFQINIPPGLGGSGMLNDRRGAGLIEDKREDAPAEQPEAFKSMCRGCACEGTNDPCTGFCHACARKAAWAPTLAWGVPDCEHATGRKAIPSGPVAAMEAVVRDWLLRVAGTIGPGTVVQGPIIHGLERELATALEPIVAEAFQAGASEGAGMVGAPDDFFDVQPEEAIRIVRQANGLLVEQIRETTENGIRAAIADGLGLGLPMQEVAARVRLAVEDAAPWRADMIARTETANATSAGNMAAWNQAGVDKKEWLLAPDACPICKGLAANLDGPIPMNEPFAKLGQTITGTDGSSFLVTRDVYHPPLHPNDRCAMVPVMEDA